MKPPDDSRMADEKAAVSLQRKKPSWRATRPVNGVPTKHLWSSIEPSLWAVGGLILLIFLLGWLFGVR